MKSLVPELLTVQHTNGLLSGWRTSLSKAFIHSWRKLFCFSELWLQCFQAEQPPVSDACCFFPTEVLMQDPWDVLWQNRATCRFQVQGQLKITASCNFSVVEVGLVPSLCLYIKESVIYSETRNFLNFKLWCGWWHIVEIGLRFFHLIHTS